MAAGEQFRTYDLSWPGSTASAGLKERVAEQISILDPTDTPGWALIGKEEISGPLFDWPIDSLAATSTAATAEGADYSDITAALTSRTRIQNCTQIFATGFSISRTNQIAARKGGVIGVRDEMEYQATKKMKELLRNGDARLWATGASAASATGNQSGTAVTARRMGVFRGFTAAGRSVITASIGGAFATASFATLHETMDGQGANPDTLFVSSGVKADISNLILNNNSATFGATGSPGLRRVNMNQTDNAWDGVIDVINDDFGRIMIVRDRWIPQSSTTGTTAGPSGDGAAYFLMDRSMVKICIFDPPSHIPLPPAGLSERGAVNMEVSLKLLHPSAVGLGMSVTT